MKSHSPLAGAVLCAALIFPFAPAAHAMSLLPAVTAISSQIGSAPGGAPATPVVTDSSASVAALSLPADTLGAPPASFGPVNAASFSGTDSAMLAEPQVLDRVEALRMAPTCMIPEVSDYGLLAGAAIFGVVLARRKVRAASAAR